MTDSEPKYEAYALCYATMRDRRASDLFYRYGDYGLEERLLDMACYFWVLRSRDSVILVDTGWNRHRGLGGTGGRYDHLRIDERDPLDLLAQIEVDPAAVEHVLISHMHIDHIGNLDLFPAATMVVARADFDCWTGPHRNRPALTHTVSEVDVRALEQINREGRLRFVEEGVEQVLPGITVTLIGGHSPGQLMTEVTTTAGNLILASDAVHYHEELEDRRPFYVFTDLPAMYDAYELLDARAARPGTWLVSGHDPLEMNRFEPVGEGCVDLARPLT